MGIGWWLTSTWEASPSFALYQLSVAIKSHDTFGAAYYIDFNEVTHLFAEQVIAAKVYADSGQSGEPDISDEILANERISEVEPALSNTLKEIFKQAVQSRQALTGHHFLSEAAEDWMKNPGE